ncbi:MAG TPA: sodium:solute symporter family protein [Burkholderiales bacterium]|nr:sodium:solute symporter family protein [Burkholderiales bacterium]
MLLTFVIAYLVVSLAIGLIAATRVHSAKDYVTAGRRLPIWVVFATVFATWFGAETVLGISATFLREGMGGLVSDPFGAALCLILVGLFFARPLYRMNLLTIGDYYLRRYNRPVEMATSLCIAVSYLGWVSAQITALGLVFHVVSQGEISQVAGMIIGAAVVLAYTLFGGMWSVAFTTFFQMIIIVLGLCYIAWLTSGMAGGIPAVVAHASAHGKLEFFPKLEAREMIGFIAAWVTLGLGSIPQQDVFQRVNASRNEDTAAWGSILGGSAYLLFAFVPLFLAYSATLIDPGMVAGLIDNDSQLILPTLILHHMPLHAQIIFFGALLSVIMSTASGTLLAPSVTLSENVLRGLFRPMSDDRFLRMTRVVVVCFTVLVTGYAVHTDATIHKMVENAYKITLSAAFTPLVFGLYWRRATTQGAAAAIVAGLGTWITLEFTAPGALFPPQFAALLASITAMLLGSLAPQWYGGNRARLAGNG